MANPLERVQDVVAPAEMRLATFDYRLRRRTGQWYLDERIPLSDILPELTTIGTFRRGDRGYVLPLHGVADPTPTGDYLLINANEEPPTATFWDPGRGDRRTIELSDLETSFPAWRCRFWTSAYPIDREAAIVQETATPDETTPPPSDAVEGTARSPSAAFLDRIRSDLVSQRERIRERARQTYENLGPDEYVDHHGGLKDLTFHGREVDEYGQHIVTLTVPNTHRFAGSSAEELARVSELRAGDEVILDTHSVDGLPVEAELLAVEDGAFDLAIYWDSARDGEAEQLIDETLQSIVLAKLVEAGRFAAAEAALESLDEADHRRDVYAGHGPIDFGDLPAPVDPAIPLTRRQHEAVERALASQDLYCVQSPPWTGTRRVIAETVRHALEMDWRILLLAPSGDSIAHILNGPPDNGVETESAVREICSSMDRTLHEVDRSVVVADEKGALETADVVGAPLALADTVPNHAFDLVILDHAARIDVATGAIPFTKGDRVLLLGDPEQTLESLETAESDPNLPPSIWEHLSASYGEAGVGELRIQHRMHQAIAMYANRFAYDGRLLHGQTNRGWTLDAAEPLIAMQVAGPVRETPTGSYYNEEEVAAVVSEVRRLRDRGVPPSSIGIITPESAQIGKLRVGLEEIASGLPELVTIGPPERFRCEAKDAIIVSPVHSAPPKDTKTAPFWTPSGVTVWMTRAAKRLVLIGDWDAHASRAASRDDPLASLGTFLDERGLID